VGFDAWDEPIPRIIERPDVDMRSLVADSICVAEAMTGVVVLISDQVTGVCQMVLLSEEYRLMILIQYLLTTGRRRGNLANV
jgi:hypothetical protein